MQHKLGVQFTRQERRSQLPFRDRTVYRFDQQTVDTLLEIGGVYGLACPQIFRAGWYTILYVGKTGNFRERLQYWLNNPPVAGITHFFADVIANAAERTTHEANLIAEFKPVGNTALK
jgi:excinuclease UvrABC nuclease subunit